MKLSEIVAELKSLKETITGFIGDKTKATAESLTQFSSKLTALESGTVAELTTAQNALATANTAKDTAVNEKTNALNQVSAIETALKGACTALSIEVRAGAQGCELVTQLQTAVTSTLAKLQVDPNKVPAGRPTNAGGQEVRKKSLDEEIKDRQAATATK